MCTCAKTNILILCRRQYWSTNTNKILLKIVSECKWSWLMNLEPWPMCRQGQWSLLLLERSNRDYWRLFLKLWLTRTKGKLETFLVWIAWIKWEWRCSFCLYLVLLLANLCLRDCCGCLCSRAENLDYYHVWSPEYKSWFFASQLQTSRPFRPHIPRIRFLRSSARAVASRRQFPLQPS